MHWVPAIVRPYSRLALVLAIVLMLDVTVTAASYMAHRDDPHGLPYFVSMAAEPRGTPYNPMSAALRLALHPDPLLRISPSGNVRRRVGSDLRLDPDSAAGFVLLQLADYRSAGDRAALHRAETALGDLVPLLKPGPIENPYRQTLSDGSHLPTNWVSARTQGLLLSAMSQMYEVTGIKSWRTRANQAFDSYLGIRAIADQDRAIHNRWIAAVDDTNFLWFETYPQSQLSSRLLTGHDFAIFGLVDFARIARGVRLVSAVQLYRGGLATALHYIQYVRFRNGPAWTGPTQHERSIPLHQILRAQMGTLARITGIRDFQRYQALLTRDTKVAFFFTTGLEPVGSVDAYTPESGLALPPTAPSRTSDPAGGERSDVGAAKPDAQLVSAIDDLSAFTAGGDGTELTKARRSISQVLKLTRNGFVAHPGPVDNVYGTRLKRPWYSAQTQGLLLSALSRLKTATGEDRWSQEADVVFRSLQQFRGNAGNDKQPPLIWISQSGDEKAYANLWFEKYPHPQGADGWKSGSASYVIDAHITAMIGLYDYWRITQNPLASRMFDGGASTIMARLPDIRVPGGISKTALLTDIHELEHHRVVTRQLALLAKMTGERKFSVWSARFARDAS